MKHVILGLTVATFAAGIAYAAETGNLKMPDADGDGVVARAEMQAHATQMFDFMDANHDGKLDEADRAARRAQMFDRMDTNKDGQISRQEFEAAHPMGPGAGMGRGEGMVAGMGHGMHHGMGMHHGGPDGGPGMMARLADSNKDGVVSQAEFSAAMLQHFDQADTNHDGKLTSEERKAAHGAMRDHRRHGGKGGSDCPMMPPPAQ